MRPITPGELARLKRTVEAPFPDSASVSQPGTPTKNAMGETVAGVPETWTMPCKIEPAGTSPMEQQLIAQYGATSVWTISYSSTYDLTPTATITVHGREHEVKGLLQDQSYETVRRAVCVKVGG